MGPLCHPWIPLQASLDRHFAFQRAVNDLLMSRRFAYRLAWDLVQPLNNLASVSGPLFCLSKISLQLTYVPPLCLSSCVGSCVTLERAGKRLRDFISRFKELKLWLTCLVSRVPASLDLQIPVLHGLCQRVDDKLASWRLVLRRVWDPVSSRNVLASFSGPLFRVSKS